MPLRTTVDKARKQIERRDLRGATQYRAQLKYFHYKQRFILGMPSRSTAPDRSDHGHR